MLLEGSLVDTLLAHIDKIPVRTFGSDTEAIGEDIALLTAAISRLYARVAGRIADQRALSSRPEGLGLTRWTALNGDIPDTEARSLVGMARTLVSHPDTADRIADGSLSHPRARLLARTADAHPKVYERDEEMLLGFAADQPIADLKKSLRYWRNCADDEAASGAAEVKRGAAYLHASVTYGGMVRLDGLLDPETGEALITALDAATPPPGEHDTRPAPNRRAHALGDICAQWLRNGTVDLDTLQGRYGRHCELDSTGPIDRDTALRILCDCDVTRVITRGESEILDLGRSTRVPSPAQRKALILRDRHCRFRGCDRPPKWCDAHHIVPWVLDGETNLDDLVLVCRAHHTMIHQGHATVVGHDVIPNHLLPLDGRAPP